MSIEKMKQWLKALKHSHANEPIWKTPHKEAIISLRQAIERAQKQKPWVWMPAPTKTLWANDMVEADLSIDKDHTVSIYCERDQTEKVEAMLSAQPQREWVGLTPYQFDQLEQLFGHTVPNDFVLADIVCTVESKLKENNQ